VIVQSFLRFCVEERGLEVSPGDKIKPPKRANVERRASSVRARWMSNPAPLSQTDLRSHDNRRYVK
jgi:hypothetical protein